jgi:hypothetical protein
LNGVQLLLDRWCIHLLIFYGGVEMATKSFTTDLKFDRKSADNLIQVLASHSKVKRHAPAEFEMVKDSDLIKKMFMKG